MTFTYLQLIVLDLMNITFQDTQNQYIYIYVNGKFVPCVWITINNNILDINSGLHTYAPYVWSPFDKDNII